MLKYLDSFQIVMVIYVTLGVGAFFGFIKFFTEESMKRVRRLLFMIPIATMLFYEVATTPLNKNSWMAFLHAFIIQVFLHLIAYVYAIVFRSNKSIMEKFIEASIAFTESDFFWYGYPFSQILFTQSFNNYSGLAMFVQTLCVHSIHQILVLLYIPDSVESFNKMTDPPPDEEVPLEPKENKEQVQEEPEEDAMELQDQKSDSQNEEPAQEKKEEPKEVEKQKKLDKIGNRSVSDSHEDLQSSDKQSDNKDENSSSSTPEVKVDEGKEVIKPEDVAEPEKPAKRGYSKLFWFIYSFINQHNIAAILGIFWSIAVKYTNVNMPAFLKSFSFDLEKASICAGLFCQGIFIAYHPFKGCPIVDVIASCIVHFIVKPVLAMAFCWALSIDHTVAKFLILINLAPTGLYAYTLSDQAGWKTSMITYSMYWGMICVLPVYMIWIAIINETGMFP